MRPRRPAAHHSADGRGGGWRPAPGDDPFGMLLEELVPLLSGLGLGTSPGQLAVLGWSMGAEVTVSKGCHDGAFWQGRVPAQLQFLAAAFARR